MATFDIGEIQSFGYPNPLSAEKRAGGYAHPGRKTTSGLAGL
jgi:hypothetical protein